MSDNAKSRKAFLGVGVALFVVSAWFSMACPRVEPGQMGFSLDTAGSFILGLPFIVGVGFGYAWVLHLLVRLFGRRTGWIALLLVSGLLIGLSARSCTPRAWMEFVIGTELPPDIAVASLHVHQAFNTCGMFYDGSLQGSEEAVSAFIEHLQMEKREDSTTRLHDLLPEAPIPEYDGSKYYIPGKRWGFYLDESTHTLYFCTTS